MYRALIFQVYRVAGPKLLHNVLQGFNATMIAYGQTGSGKTFTMEGIPQVIKSTVTFCGAQFPIHAYSEHADLFLLAAMPADTEDTGVTRR